MKYNVKENHMLQMLDEEEPIGYNVRIYDYEDNEVEVIYVDVDDDIDKSVKKYMQKNDLDSISYDWEIVDDVY